MTEFTSGGGEEQKEDDGPLGPIGKCVARRERRRGRDEAAYHRIQSRLASPVRTEDDMRRREDDLNRLLVLEERLGLSGRNPYADADAEQVHSPDDAVPQWLRDRWVAQANAGGAVLGLVSAEEYGGPDDYPAEEDAEGSDEFALSKDATGGGLPPVGWDGRDALTTGLQASRQLGEIGIVKVISEDDVAAQAAPC